MTLAAHSLSLGLLPGMSLGQIRPNGAHLARALAGPAFLAHQREVSREGRINRLHPVTLRSLCKNSQPNKLAARKAAMLHNHHEHTT